MVSTDGSEGGFVMTKQIRLCAEDAQRVHTSDAEKALPAEKIDDLIEMIMGLGEVKSRETLEAISESISDTLENLLYMEWIDNDQDVILMGLLTMIRVEWYEEAKSHE